jgi:LPS export ABC transporter protein LptC
MIFIKNNILFILTVFLLGILSISCENNLKDVQKMNDLDFIPSGDAENFVAKYTDSGKIKSVLISEKMLDYTNVKYAFTEFPKGIDLTLYDNNGKKTFVKAKLAISYKATKIIDLQGDVTITNDAGQKMKTEQLYFDQKNEWFYTEKSFIFTSPEANLTGVGVDFSKDFKIMNTQKLKGQIKTSK